MAHTSEAAALPAELLADILEYLPDDELWTAARVSRQFYVAAWRAGLSIHRDIELKAQSAYADELVVFKDLVEQARRKDVLRISLSLTCFFSGKHDPRRLEEDYAAFQPSADEIFPVVSSALPFLVYLSIDIPDHFRPQLDAALRHPAPRLRTLDIDCILHQVPCTLPIPGDLFAGSAPLLRTLTLRTIRLPDTAVPAFRAVSQAVLSYSNLFPRINYRDQLPRLKDLDLQFTVSANGHPALPDYSDIAGLALRSLVIEDDSSATPLLDAVTRSVDLSAIPVVLVVGEAIKWDKKLWADDNAALSIRLTCSPDAPFDEAYLLANVSPEHRRWRRLYLLNDWDTSMPVPLGGLPNVHARLTYLRADALAVRSLLELQLSLAALRNLRIDLRGHDSEPTMIQPPDYDGAALDVLSFSALRVWTPCPALEQLVLFARRRPLTVDSRRVACLANALGQLGRRVPLALVGVAFDEPVADALLDQTVRTTVTHAFGDAGWRACNDEGLWDFELFNRIL